MRHWQRDDPTAAMAFRAAAGDVEFQTDGTSVNTTAGWREMRLSIFAKRQRGRPSRGRQDWEQRHLPAPHVRVIQAGIRTCDQLGPGWRRQAGRLGLRDTSAITALADGAKWIWGQLDKHLPGCQGVLDIWHASQRLWEVAKAALPESAVSGWVQSRRATLLAGGAVALEAELQGAQWTGVRGYFEPHGSHTGYAARLAAGQSIGSGLVEGSCKQVIGRRLKQTGAQWRVRRAERMATLCSVQASGQWADYWASSA